MDTKRNIILSFFYESTNNQIYPYYNKITYPVRNTLAFFVPTYRANVHVRLMKSVTSSFEQKRMS